MFLLCLAAFLGSGLAAALAWPVLGLGAVIIAPFGGSVAASVAAAFITFKARATGHAWIEALELETAQPASNDVSQIHEGEYRQYA
jgi:hypothetical protein